MRDDFAVARVVIAVLEILGWITVAVGAVVMVFALSGSASGIGALGVGWGLLAGFIIAVTGVLQIAAAQVVKAGVTTAENSSVIRALAERHFGSSPTGAQRVASSMPLRTPEGVIKLYKGHSILRVADGVRVDGEDRVFKNVIAAERFIDGR